MSRYLKKDKSHIGISPDLLIFVGQQKTDKTLLRLLDYDAEFLIEKRLESIEEINEFLDKKNVTWLNIDGIHDTEMMQSLSEKIKLNKIVFSDVMNSTIRPKVQEYKNGLFISLKMLDYNEKEDEITAETISFILTDNFLFSFQEKRGDVFEPVRERIRKNRKKIRSSKTDYLLFALLDIVIDNYIYVISRLGEKIEELDESIIENADEDLLSDINQFKKEISYIKRLIKPVYDMLIRLNKIESTFIEEENQVYYKELENNISHAIDSTDSYREILSDQLNIYHTNLSTKLNDVMKVLTIFSVIFIPITFIAGIYGTNFDNIPELHYKYGYFAMWGAILTVALIMLFYFKKKKWF